MYAPRSSIALAPNNSSNDAPIPGSRSATTLSVSQLPSSSVSTTRVSRTPAT